MPQSPGNPFSRSSANPSRVDSGVGVVTAISSLPSPSGASKWKFHSVSTRAQSAGYVKVKSMLESVNNANSGSLVTGAVCLPVVACVSVVDAAGSSVLVRLVAAVVSLPVVLVFALVVVSVMVGVGTSSGLGSAGCTVGVVWSWSVSIACWNWSPVGPFPGGVARNTAMTMGSPSIAIPVTPMADSVAILTFRSLILLAFSQVFLARSGCSV